MGEEAFYELASEWRPLPAPFDDRQGLYLSGNNHSDDLFMFIKRRVSGLKPNTAYTLSFEVELVANAGAGCVGIGGAPGESVYVKVGATADEPMAVRDQANDYRMTNDKGRQSQGGQDAIVIGDLANPQLDCGGDNYAPKVLTSNKVAFEAITDNTGRIWLMVGTDSGFEGVSKVYYTRVSVTAEEI